MNIKHHTHPDQLERYSFLWSEARLMIAALALFIGGIPPVLAFNPIPALQGFLSSLLTFAWVASGLASGYLLYRWNRGGKMLFGKKDQRDTVAFFVSVVSGINLGFTGLFGTNLGMSITSSRFIFFIAGILYLYSAHHLYRHWKAYGKKLF
ncbi:MAG: hypothetical protein Q7S28_01570 [bacterium]|nr:hypothetical protein [bacterium]